MTLDRKQDLNVIYQVCVFRADRKNKMAALTSNWLRHFQLLLWNRRTNSTKLERKQDLNFLYQGCVFPADHKNKMATLASDWLRHFRLLLCKCWTEFNETWQEARSQRPILSLCFSCWSENKMAALASDWLRHFWLLLWTRWMEFNETWQEARSQRPLPCLYYSGRSVNKNGRPGRFLKIRWYIVLRCICGPLGLLFYQPQCIQFPTCNVNKDIKWVEHLNPDHELAIKGAQVNFLSSLSQRPSPSHLHKVFI